MGDFTCAECGETFTKGWSDEEMLAEAAVNGFDESDGVVVCEDCFALIMEANGHPTGEPK